MTAPETETIVVSEAVVRSLVSSLEEAVNILTFAFEDGALTHEQVVSLYVDPYGALADMRSSLKLARGQS